MDPNFWHERWKANQIGFHEGEANAHLVAQFGSLNLGPNSRIFVPLCGKTRDIAWLLDKGHRVVGAELSQTAIQQLFEELGVQPDISERGDLTRYSATGIDIFVGDIFALTAAELGPVDAIFDRAALVALPAAMRARYAAHLIEITKSAPQLLVTFEYDQSVMEGPPFSLSAAEVRRHYEGSYSISERARVPVKGGLKGVCPATEAAWLLMPKQAAR